MSCPLYKDFTRECVKHYNRILQFSSYNICESDNYDECPLYNIINKKVQCCEYTPACDEKMDFGNWDYEYLKYVANNFCFYGRKGDCAIYKLRTEKKAIPRALQPDGRMIEGRVTHGME